jgi:D-glycero-alpha-D-manno-heptose-7-phosphate kinase
MPDTSAHDRPGHQPGAFIHTSRTPLRVSLFGGGTDYPEWFEREPGAVLGFTIDKYIYISALRLSSFVDYRYRVTYSRLETVDEIAQIQHPVVRVVLEHEGFVEPMDYSIQADLPASAGLGSSSAFTTGFLNLVSAMKGVPRTKLELARLAIDTEHNLLRERVGIQDQLHAAFGGINRFDFHGEELSIKPISVSAGDLDALTEWMTLVYTGIQRSASQTLDEQLDNISARSVDDELRAMVGLVDRADEVLQHNTGDELAHGLAELLAETWQMKKRLSGKVSNPEIDALYEACVSQGALAGKLCGAGGGGFLLMIVPPERRAALAQAVGPDRCVDFRIEHQGSLVRQTW